MHITLLKGWWIWGDKEEYVNVLNRFLMISFNSFAVLTHVNNRWRPLLKRDRGHVLDLQSYLKISNSCPLCLAIFTKQLLNSPNNSPLQLTCFFPIWHHTFCYDFQMSSWHTLVHVLLHLLLIREGYLAWFENEAFQQGKEGCKLKRPSHSTSINLYTH